MKAMPLEIPNTFNTKLVDIIAPSQFSSRNRKTPTSEYCLCCRLVRAYCFNVLRCFDFGIYFTLDFISDDPLERELFGSSSRYKIQTRKHEIDTDPEPQNTFRDLEWLFETSFKHVFVLKRALVVTI